MIILGFYCVFVFKEIITNSFHKLQHFFNFSFPLLLCTLGLLNLKRIIYMYACVLKYMHVWHVHGGAWEGKKRHWTPQTWSYKWLWAPTWVLGIVPLQEQWVLLTWAMVPVPKTLFLFYLHVLHACMHLYMCSVSRVQKRVSDHLEL